MHRKPSSQYAPSWPLVTTEKGPYLRIDSKPEVRENFLDEYMIAVKEGMNAGAHKCALFSPAIVLTLIAFLRGIN